MDFVIVGQAATPGLRWFRQGLWQTLRAYGHTFLEEPTRDVRLVLNFTDPSRPRPFRRKSQGTFVASIVELPQPPADFLKTCYPILVRALSNLLIVLIPGPSVGTANGVQWEAHFVTLELGHYKEVCQED
ncbi:MAG: class II aldolase/adducin family protein, partial [Thermoflexus sp.]